MWSGYALTIVFPKPMRPNALIAQKYLARGARLWIGTRLLGSAVVALAGMHPLRLSFASTLVIVGASTALGLVDLLRRHELALLDNLGVSRATLAGFFAGPAIIGELSISLAVLVLG